MFSSSKCERFREDFFPFSKKHNCKQKSVKKICKVTTNSFTDEVVKKQQNIYKVFEFVSVVKNL